MASVLNERGNSSGLIRFHHGTDLICANDILRHGLDANLAATWNGSGEFWKCPNRCGSLREENTMHQQQLYTSWMISCDSPESARRSNAGSLGRSIWIAC